MILRGLYRCVMGDDMTVVTKSSSCMYSLSSLNFILSFLMTVTLTASALVFGIYSCLGTVVAFGS